MQNKKALFFDVDGTLYSEINGMIPTSALEAVKEARKNGHLVFVNTGRSYCQTALIRRDMEMDGILCGCGTYIRVGEEVLYNREIPEEEGRQIKEAMLKAHIDGVLEGVNGCGMLDEVSRFPDVERVKKMFIEEGAVDFGAFSDDTFRFSKFCMYADEKSDKEAFFSKLKGFSVVDRGAGFFECVPEGHSKATAMEVIAKHYGISKENIWAFGDSMNDLPMIQYAPNAVLMGKHSKALEPFASFITKTVEEDGIRYALESFGMI